MTVLLTIVGTAAMMIAYILARGEAADFLDGQLRQVALSAGLILPNANAPPAADQDPEDQIAVTIWQSGTVARNDLPKIPLVQPNRRGFADITIGGEPWRSYATGNDVWTIQVAQRDKVRQEFARSAAIGAAAPILILIPLSWLVVGWAMNRILGHLDILARDLADRSAAAAGPISLERVPREVVPLVEGMNRLIVRLRVVIDAQKRFLSDAAHELRTPLAAIQIQVDNLSVGAPQRFEEGRTAIAKGAKRASVLVSQLLRLARLDEPGLPPGEEAVELGPLLLDCLSEHVMLAEQKGIDLGVNLGAFPVAHGSAAELTILFSNLVDNAVRYTPSGGKVDVSLSRYKGEAVVEVLDTGPGLPPGSETRIFDRFFRAAPPGIDGSGLGLAIALRIAERNAVLLTVENRRDGCAGVLARVVLG